MTVYSDGHRRVERRGPTTAGGAYAQYVVLEEATGEEISGARFQHDTIPLVGVVGQTNETLLAMVIDRLECFQQSPFACQENADALEASKRALSRLNDRTKARKARGVEGQHVK